MTSLISPAPTLTNQPPTSTGKTDADDDIGTTPSVIQLMESIGQNNPAALASLHEIQATPTAIAQLSQALTHHSAIIRIGAAYTLAAMGPKAETAIPALVNSLARKLWNPSEEDFRAMAIYALGEINPLHPDALGALGSMTAHLLSGYENGQFEPSLLVRAVAIEALGKIDRQANAGNLFTLLPNEESALFSPAWGAEFVLAAPMDEALAVILFQYLSETNTPTEIRLGAAKLIEIKTLDDDKFVANNFDRLAAPLVTIVADDTADLTLRQQAASSLTKSIFFLKGAANTMRPLIPQLNASFEQEKAPEALHPIATVLSAIYTQIESAPAPISTPNRMYTDSGYELDRHAAAILTTSITEEKGVTQPTRPAICHLAIAPHMIPECR